MKRFDFASKKQQSLCRSGAVVFLVFTLAFSLVLLLGAKLVQAQPTNCQNDLDGANDVTQKDRDITRFCVGSGTSPYEVLTLWNWDEVALTGGNTGDACSIYDTDSDGYANLAVCVTIGGNPASLVATSLYTCNDTKPDRCAGPSPITAVNTYCGVSQQSTDPFTSGSNYPVDTEALCAVDLDDFGAGGATATLLNVCSYPSSSINNNPFDCILFTGGCTSDIDCNDNNDCTADICYHDAVLNADYCKYTPTPGASCGDTSDTVCDNPDTCNELGFCQDNYEPLTTLCRADAGDCDVPEYCDGAGSCPADSFEPATTTCTGASNGGACDATDYCSGTDNSCVDGYQPSTYECRADAGQCDVAENCTGTSGACPPDSFEPAGTACGDGSDTDCDDPDTCDASGFCQPNYEPAGTECSDNNICTDDSCNGSGICETTFHPENDPSCRGICRSSGFWGSRGGNEGGCNYSQILLNAAGGCLNVCGNPVCFTDESSLPGEDPVGDLGSTGEGLCVKMIKRADDENNSNQLYKEVLTATLNCVLTGAYPNCATLFDTFFGEGAWDNCTEICESPTERDAVVECSLKLECWNNGLTWVDDGSNSGCAFGFCSGSGEPCEGRDFGRCHKGEICYQQNFCSDLSLCNTGNDYLLSELLSECNGYLNCETEELGAASSSKLCQEQSRSKCSFAQPDKCDPSACGELCP